MEGCSEDAWPLRCEDGARAGGRQGAVPGLPGTQKQCGERLEGAGLRAELGGGQLSWAQRDPLAPGASLKGP